MTLLWKDARHALRTFCANPGLTGTVIAALVIGIGANAAIFSLVNAVLLEPVPFPEPERLVFVTNSTNGVPANPMASPPKFMHWRAQMDVLEDVTAFRNTPMTYATGGVPEQVIQLDPNSTEQSHFFRVAARLTESVMLSGVGGALGLFAGYLGMRALMSVNTGNLPRLGEAGAFLGLDWRVVTFTLSLSLLTGVIFGLAPALTASRTDPNTALKDSGSRGAGGGLWQSKMRSALVVLELGLAVVLLIGAALMIRTMLTLGQVDPGFATDNVVTMRTALTEPRFAAASAVERTARNALERIRSNAGRRGRRGDVLRSTASRRGRSLHAVQRRRPRG